MIVATDRREQLVVEPVSWTDTRVCQGHQVDWLLTAREQALGFHDAACLEPTSVDLSMELRGDFHGLVVDEGTWLVEAQYIRCNSILCNLTPGQSTVDQLALLVLPLLLHHFEVSRTSCQVGYSRQWFENHVGCLLLNAVDAPTTIQHA